MRDRLLLCALVAAVLALAPVSAPAATRPVEGSGAEPVAKAGRSWAASEIARIVAAGLMGPDVATFRPDDPLTRGELHDAIVALGKPHAAPVDPTRIVSMRELDAQLVAAVGALPASRAIRLAATTAGLQPTAMLVPAAATLLLPLMPVPAAAPASATAALPLAAAVVPTKAPLPPVIMPTIVPATIPVTTPASIIATPAAPDVVPAVMLGAPAIQLVAPAVIPAVSYTGAAVPVSWWRHARRW
jgi:hypothetical protein